MKKAFFFFAVSMISMAHPNRAHAQNVGSDDPAAAMLREFHTSYITLVASDSNTARQLVALQNKYCTAKFFKRIPEAGGDYKIDAVW